MLPISASAPSAVCMKEIESLTLRAAISLPRIWLVSFAEIDTPAASTAAEKVRLPVDSWFIATFMERSLVSSAAWANMDFTLVLITDMVQLL